MPGLTYRFISVILVAAFSDSLRTLSGYPIEHPALSVSSVPSWVILYRLLLWFEYRRLNASTASTERPRHANNSTSALRAPAPLAMANAVSGSGLPQSGSDPDRLSIQQSAPRAGCARGPTAGAVVYSASRRLAWCASRWQWSLEGDGSRWCRAGSSAIDRGDCVGRRPAEQCCPVAQAVSGADYRVGVCQSSRGGSGFRQ